MEDRHVSVADVHEATPRDEVVIVAASSDVEAPAAVACVVPSDNYHVVAACNEDVATEPPALPVVATRPTAATVEVDSSPASPSCDTPIERVPSVQTHMASPDDVEWYGLDRVTRPWTVVPELPPVESLECVYNDDARGLQKRILRAVKWCTNADKVKLDEFKINSRLFGNGFMDPDEYTQSMAHELGPLNMLVIIPCMLRLQPDPLKKQLLYMALQSYRTKSMATLEALVVRG
ncbi:hypothetical protein DYB32_001413 [Aphanomyces invadans]|uniref:ZNF598/HEL2 PAH domain-containing protein n=1 Tax=Aphanomyces invadans TaxID=157072 RepID=A0A3R6VGB5_9STRA|nr:hypothetical protein DYB32_001413 [Aphanomyces invadans]